MDDATFWREEVASRVESYRARRRRRPRERSLPLDFERAVNREEFGGLAPETSVSVADDSPATFHAEEGDSFGDPEFADDRGPTTEDSCESNIIAFPRPPTPPVVTPPGVEELAEPVLDRPRILDVPEEVETSQAPLAGISLEPEEEEEAVGFELPLQGATLSQRAFAGLVDLLIVMVGAAVFVMVTLKAGVPMPHAKAGFLMAMAAPGFFWAIYQYIFLVHAGTTPGMQLGHLMLVTFDGYHASRRRRRARALAMVMSSLSLGLGLLWALLDEDTLCWHDRITRTYIVSSQ